MAYVKRYDNGLRLIVNKMEGLFSVSLGIMVKTGSINETEKENGISHFIEHCLFKGTDKRSAFKISDDIDSIGAQINAYTAKETTCYYTKSTSDHLEETMEILSDIFFNSKFDEQELEKEKGVVIEEIKMSEDTPEDICFDLLALSRFGNAGIGQTILGPEKNIKKFTSSNIRAYMDKYYTPENTVISVAGKLDEREVEDLVEQYFLPYFKSRKTAKQVVSKPVCQENLYKYKKIEQTHIALSVPAFDIFDKQSEILNIANYVFGGGMSSRLFQKVREQLGLCYSIYSYISAFKDSGVLEIYAGVNTALKDKALKAILEEFELMRNGITESEFYRAKEQIKSSFIMRQEYNSSQMMLYAKNLLFEDKVFDFDEKLKFIENVKLEEVNDIITKVFVKEKLSSSVVGPIRKPLNLI